MRHWKAFLIGTFLCGIYCLLTLSRPAHLAADNAVLTHGPIVGSVTADSASVFVRTSEPAQVSLRYSESGDLDNPSTSTPQETGFDHDFTARISLTDLNPNTTYYLDVLVNGVSQKHSPYSQFKTFPASGAPTSFKIVVMNDFGEKGSSKPPLPGKIHTFKRASAEHPAFVIIGGDFGHNNMSTLQDKRQQYKNFYSIPSPAGRYSEFIRRILFKYPVAHMWDDHDFGANNADKTYPFKQLSYQVLNEFFPVYPLTPYGDWQKFSYAQADFFLLDSRSQRDPNTEPDGPNKSMLDGDNLGSAGQLEWLEQGLLDSTAVWKFIVTPVSFNPTLKKPDSWRRFRRERNQLIQFIHTHSISGVILISGDAHLGALDDGTNSDFPEMLVPGPNLTKCATTRKAGSWSHGVYWSGQMNGSPCNGYGLISVNADPPSVQLQVKDTEGDTRLELTVKP